MSSITNGWGGGVSDNGVIIIMTLPKSGLYKDGCSVVDAGRLVFGEGGIGGVTLVVAGCDAGRFWGTFCGGCGGLLGDMGRVIGSNVPPITDDNMFAIIRSMAAGSDGSDWTDGGL